MRGENSKRERSYNPLLGRFLDEQREREQQDFEDKAWHLVGCGQAS